jgi:hypothetical protein
VGWKRRGEEEDGALSSREQVYTLKSTVVGRNNGGN